MAGVEIVAAGADAPGVAVVADGSAGVRGYRTPVKKAWRSGGLKHEGTKVWKTTKKIWMECL
jgi:hypothetical protein